MVINHIFARLIHVSRVSPSQIGHAHNAAQHLHLLGCHQPIQHCRMYLPPKGLGSWQKIFFTGMLGVLAFWHCGLRLNWEHTFHHLSNIRRFKHSSRHNTSTRRFYVDEWPCSYNVRGLPLVKETHASRELRATREEKVVCHGNAIPEEICLVWEIRGGLREEVAFSAKSQIERWLPGCRNCKRKGTEVY